VILLLILSCPFDSCPNFECYDFSLVERRRSEDSVVGVGWLLLDILCSFFLHSPVHVSFLALPIPLMAYHASMGVGGVVRLVFLSFSLSLSSIHDDFFDLDDSFLSCDEWLEYSGIDWRVLGRRGGFFFFLFFDFCWLAHFFDVVQYNAQFSYAVQARFLGDRDQTCRNRMLNKYQGVS
jgi:hypothetical protein